MKARRGRLVSALAALDDLNSGELALVAQSAVERIRPATEDSMVMHWRTFGKLIRQQLDRIEFEGDASDEIREFTDDAASASEGGAR